MNFETIVVGTDGSENALRAVETAADMASTSGSTVHVVSAYQARSDREIAEILAALPDEFHESYDPVAGSRAILNDASHLFDQRHVDHKVHLVEGNPAAVILDVAEDVDADLVIVGSRGLGVANRFLRGSTSARIANHAECSFLVIHD